MDRDNNRGMRDWLIFIRTAEAGSVTGAARQLDVTPAAVSKAVNRFEQYLSTTLFTRTPQGMRLTEAGQTTLTRAREIADSFHALLEEIRGDDAMVKGSVRLAASAVVCEHLACYWSYDYTCQHPDVRVFLDARERDDLRRDSPELDDLVLRSGRIESEDLVHRSLSPVRLMLCASPSYLRQHDPLTHPRDLAGHRLFGMHQHGLAGPLMLSRGDESFLLEVPPGGGVSSNNLMAMLGLVLQGRGISLAMPCWLASGYVARGELVPVLPEWKIPDLPVWLIWRQRPRQTKLFMHFRDYIEQCWEMRPRSESVTNKG
ncbi:LysR family transcriptional regulator [Erwinia aphidicola]|uniref:LysR family transcriptional regulator n=1 Tax=Erwinia aphidicola TaxID=68334 RepID=A0ABU8DLZ3_ERWAP